MGRHPFQPIDRRKAHNHRWTFKAQRSGPAAPQLPRKNHPRKKNEERNGRRNAADHRFQKGHRLRRTGRTLSAVVALCASVYVWVFLHISLNQKRVF